MIEREPISKPTAKKYSRRNNIQYFEKYICGKMMYAVIPKSTDRKKENCGVLIIVALTLLTILMSFFHFTHFFFFRTIYVYELVIRVDRKVVGKNSLSARITSDPSRKSPCLHFKTFRSTMSFGNGLLVFFRYSSGGEKLLLKTHPSIDERNDPFHHSQMLCFFVTDDLCVLGLIKILV